MTTWLKFFATFMFNVFDLMASWQIVDGVSVLGFIIALMSMAIIFGAILYRV